LGGKSASRFLADAVEKRLAHIALNARIEKEAPKVVPIEINDENYLGGARLYRTNCAVCHGLPNQSDTATSKGVFPRPPQLFKGHGVTDDPVGETYWKVSNGIRPTGMPSYAGALSEKEMWQVSLMLAHEKSCQLRARQSFRRP
jgi:thiosulfate dehydrogenase